MRKNVNFNNIINNEVSDAALMVSIFGIPTMNPRKRIFFDDADSSMRFVKIAKKMATSRIGLTLESVNRFFSMVKSGIPCDGLTLNYHVEEEAKGEDSFSFVELPMLQHEKAAGQQLSLAV